MSNEKFDKIGYEFTLASGDHDWSDCNFYGEKNGKKTWLGTLATETIIHGSGEYWTYEDIEDFARKAVIGDEMYRLLKRQCYICKLKDHETECDICEINKVLKKAIGQTEGENK